MSEGVWEHSCEGEYRLVRGRYDALVKQSGETWSSYVYVDGIEVDRGEWDGRGHALRNAEGAMRRARFLRSPTKFKGDEDENDDE